MIAGNRKTKAYPFRNTGFIHLGVSHPVEVAEAY